MRRAFRTARSVVASAFARAFVAAFPTAIVVLLCAGEKDAFALDVQPVFPLDIAIATDGEATSTDPEGAPVVSARFIEQEVALAERVLSELGLHVQIARTRSLPPSRARVMSLPERDSFAAIAAPHAISVFVVSDIADSEVAGMYRRGVTWQTRGPSHARYILLAATAAESSLAHELGHFFGIQPESRVKNNLMSYDRDDALVFLDPPQRAIVRRTAASFVAARTLSIGWRGSDAEPH